MSATLAIYIYYVMTCDPCIYIFADIPSILLKNINTHISVAFLTHTLTGCEPQNDISNFCYLVADIVNVDK